MADEPTETLTLDQFFELALAAVDPNLGLDPPTGFPIGLADDTVGAIFGVVIACLMG